MPAIEPNEMSRECGMIAVLASLVMDGLLTRVIGAPNTLPIAVIALMSGLSTAAIFSLLFPGSPR